MRAVFEKIESDENASFAVREIDQEVFDAPWHFHPECELTYICEGEGERFVGDSWQAFAAGDLVLLGAGLPHFWRSRKSDRVERSRAVVVHFSEGFLGDEMGGAGELSGLRRLLLAARRGLCFSRELDLCRRLSKRMQELAGISGLKRLILLLEILSKLFEAESSLSLLSSVGHVPLRDQKAEQRISRAYEYVYAHLNEEITLEAVSQSAGMSSAAFSRYFKRMTGRNLSHFIGELRISQACKHLRETQLGVSEVAYEVGFGSLSNFNRLFKQLKGVSPREWRGGNK